MTGDLRSESAPPAAAPPRAAPPGPLPGEPLDRYENRAVRRLGAEVVALVAAAAAAQPGPPHPVGLPEAVAELADVDGYADVARRALSAAAARVEEIHAGRREYEADRAFSGGEVSTLGRAARVALIRDGYGDALGRLVRGVVVAPTAARTVPSQALLYEIARAVADVPDAAALAALREARGLARHRGVHHQLDRMLRRVERALAARPGLALALPDLGFGGGTTREVDLGGHVAVLAVGDAVTLTWRRPDGSTTATVPAAVRRAHADAVTALRREVRAVRGQLAGLARVLAAGMGAGSVTPFHRWAQELAGCPLAGTVAGRLIWEVQRPDGSWLAFLPDGGDPGALHGLDGRPAQEPDAGASLRLWHPLRAGVEQVRAWRDRLDHLGIAQPVRQAYREVYPLTPAERETRTYSRRFAGHIVRYRQLYALLRGRGWDPGRMLGPWDSGDDTEAGLVVGDGTWRFTLDLAYLAEAVDGIELAGVGDLRLERRVRPSWQPADLADVPPVLLSEVLRDVDLFVSVASVAADPQWLERGGRFEAYWRDTGFGPLSAAAQVRRDALIRVVPRLRIAERCAVGDRYLHVRGDLGAYRIHLGSGNVLTEPGGRYLCIVASGRHERVFLPFEEDLLGLILSKAFLLADDARITDPSILAQIRLG
jgi:hypothetical protein